MRSFGSKNLIKIFLGTESVHAGLRQSDRVHNCHSNKNLGTESHVKMSLRSILFYNAKNYYRKKDSNAYSVVADQPADVPPGDMSSADLSVNPPLSPSSSTTLTASPSVSIDLANEVPLLTLPSSPPPPPPPSLPLLPTPAPPPPERSLKDALRDSGMNLRENVQAQQTVSGNCWSVLLF